VGARYYVDSLGQQGQGGGAAQEASSENEDLPAYTLPQNEAINTLAWLPFLSAVYLL
jgi:hypothetical protein